MHPHLQARALCYNPQLNHLAVGHNDGCVSIRQVAGIEDAAAGGSHFVKLDEVTDIKRQPKEWIECMEYSPDGSKLAVGSHDNFIYVYNTN